MAKEEGIEVQGTIIEKHPGGTFEVRQNDVLVVQPHFKRTARMFLDDGALNFDAFFFRH